MPPDLAVGGRASASLIGALEKLPQEKLQDPHKRSVLFKKMVEVLSALWVHACVCSVRIRLRG